VRTALGMVKAGSLFILESYGILLIDDVELLLFTFWKYDPGPTSVVVEVGGTIGSCPLTAFLEVIEYLGAFWSSGLFTGS
jgi:hypothetical protein